MNEISRKKFEAKNNTLGESKIHKSTKKYVRAGLVPKYLSMDFSWLYNDRKGIPFTTENMRVDLRKYGFKIQ